MITLAIVLIALLCVAVALSPRFSPSLYRKLVFAPDPYREEDYRGNVVGGITAEDVFLTSTDGVIIHGWFFHIPGATHAVLFNHGNAGNVGGWGAIAEHAIRNGMSALVYDYRGYGRSSGDLSLAGAVEDGLTAFDHLVTDRGFAPERIVLVGVSLGSGLACEIARQRTHAGLVLQGAFSHFFKLSKEVVSIGRLIPNCLGFRPVMDNARTVSQLTTPKLIIHGALDDLIIVRHAHDLFARASQPKLLVILPKSPHTGFGTEEEERLCARSFDSFLQPLLTEIPSS